MKSFRLILVAWLFALASGCAVNPVTGKNELSLIPESQEIAIGAEQYAPSQQAQGGRYTVDPDVERYVSDVGQRLAAVSDRELPYEFVVLNDSTPNAWALPGGKIAINRGLLVELDNEAELAAVLGHEIVHSAARHGAQAMQRGMLLQGVVLATALGAAASDNEYANVIVGGAQLGAQLINQSYGRDAELESDYYGMRYMKRAGYNPAAAVSLQETFVRLSEGGQTSWLEGLFSSHPPSGERVAANRQTAEALGMTGETNAGRYREANARLFETLPAYNAFDEAGALLAKNQTEDAMARIEEAIGMEPAEPRFYGMKGQILLAQRRYKAAADEFDKALVRDDGFYQYYLGRGLARMELGDRQQARADLERSNQFLPTAIANARLGDIAQSFGDRSTAKSYYQTAMTAQGAVGEQAQTAFVRLDLPDRPGNYLQAEPFLTDDRRLAARISNTTPIAVAGVEVQFEVTVNGNRIRRVTTLGGLGGGDQRDVTSGWQFGESDVLSDAIVRVIGARIN